MARKLKKKKEKLEKIVYTSEEAARALEHCFRDIMHFEIVRERMKQELKPDMPLEEKEENISKIKQEVTAHLASPGFLEEIGEEYIKSIEGVPIYLHWESSVMNLPAINWKILLEDIAYPYWLEIERYRNNPTEEGERRMMMLDFSHEVIAHRIQIVQDALHKFDGSTTDTRKLVLLLIKIKQAIKRTRTFWKREKEIEVTLGKGKKKKTEKIIDKNYLEPRYHTRLTKAENIILEILGRIPICSLTNQLMQELDFEICHHMTMLSNKEVRAMEKRGEATEESNKIYEVLELPFVNDCLSLYALPDYLSKKFGKELRKYYESKKFETLKKHLKAYSDMITKEVMIVTTEEIKMIKAKEEK